MTTSATDTNRQAASTAEPFSEGPYQYLFPFWSPIPGGCIPGEIRWEYLNVAHPADEWQPFPFEKQWEVTNHYNRWMSRAVNNPQDDGEQGIAFIDIGVRQYKIDFVHMLQYNLSTGRQRLIRQVVVPSIDFLFNSVFQLSQLLCNAEAHLFVVQEELLLAEEHAHRLEMEQEFSENELEELSARLVEAEVVEEEFATQISRLTEENKELDTQSMQLRLQIRELTQEKDDLNVRFLEAEARLADVDGRCESAEARVRELLNQEAQQSGQFANMHLALTAQSQWQSIRMVERMVQIEAWRQPYCSRPIKPVREGGLALDAELTARLQCVLRSTSHEDPSSRCSPMKSATVVGVHPIVNGALWQSYQEAKHKIRLHHQRMQTAVQPLVSESMGHFEVPLPWINCEAELNERIVFHGTPEVNLGAISTRGFDELFAREGLYGSGVYFSDQSCKSFQYSGNNDVHCLLLVRVILGATYVTTGPMRGHRRPPPLDEKNPACGLYDSIFADVGIPNGQASGTQQHREFVIFKGEQAYPEFAIFFKV